MKDREVVSNTSSVIDRDALNKELLEENDFLIKLVDTIPAKMYFEHDIQEQITAEKHSAMDKATSALKHKSNGMELSAKEKHKRARLDPMNQKTVSQIQEELSMKKEKKIKKNKGLFTPSASLSRAANIEELQKRLQERINELHVQRKAAANSDPKIKKQLKKKMKKLKHKGNMMKAPELNNAAKTPKKPKIDPSSLKPVFNKESNLIYSKFDFSEDGNKDTNKNEYSGKKVKTLLKNAEKKKEKIDKMKTVNPEKAKTVEEKEKWKKAIQKSEGLKVKDDPNLLKRSLKSEEKRKKKSAKDWKGRIEHTDKRQKARQDKRDRNIKMKKKEKFDKKIKYAKKKGRLIPGF